MLDGNRDPPEAASPSGMESLAPSGQPALTIASAGAEAILEQFQGSPLLAAGKLSIVALDAVADRLGARWRVRRDLVHEHAERVLRRVCGADALVQRISETEYVVAQPEAPRAAAQLRCVNGLKEILTHFLGEARSADVRVHVVTRITDEGVFGQRLDAAAAEAAEFAERASRPADEPSPASLDRWTPYTTTTGKRVGVSCSLEPVVQLKTSGRIGYRIGCRIQHLPALAALSRREFERLAPSDLERIDFATIARGLDRLKSLGGWKPPALIVPISYGTLQSRGGRATIIGLLRQARDFVVHGLICEITGLDGAPTGPLQAAIAALRPFCLHIVGRISDGRVEEARRLIGVGLDGVSVRAPRTSGDAELSGFVRVFVRAASLIARTRFLYQVADLRQAKIAAELGVTHATLAPQRLKVHFIDDEPR